MSGVTDPVTEGVTAFVTAKTEEIQHCDRVTDNLAVLMRIYKATSNLKLWERPRCSRMS